MKRLTIFLAFLAAVLLNGVVYMAGLTEGARRWKARAESATAWVDLQQQTGRHFDACQDYLARCRAVCSEPLEPVRWER